jgi:hypothetical protein
LSALELKATNAPSREISGKFDPPSAPFIGDVPVRREIRIVVLAWVSRTKTSSCASTSSALRLSANEWKATKRPSPEIDA